MCYGAGAKAPVGSSRAPAVGWGSPGGTRDVRMGLGRGVQKAAGGVGLG